MCIRDSPKQRLQEHSKQANQPGSPAQGRRREEGAVGRWACPDRRRPGGLGPRLGAPAGGRAGAKRCRGQRGPRSAGPQGPLALSTQPARPSRKALRTQGP
eukprot:15444401-Alexandrium_andersonii.AAC.1